MAISSVPRTWNAREVDEAERWRAWVLAQAWKPGPELDRWVDAAVGTRHLSRGGGPAKVSVNALTLLNELLVCYQVDVRVLYGLSGYRVTVGEDTDYEAGEAVSERFVVALAVATLLYFAPPREWLRSQEGKGG
jgi:hypothetical protein